MTTATGPWPRIGRHRRYTANHTWWLDIAGKSVFLKANPHPIEARQELVGHRLLTGVYPIPRLLGAARLGRWSLHAYERVPGLDVDCGLLLDLLATADHPAPSTTGEGAGLKGHTGSGPAAILAAAAGDILDRYRTAIGATLYRASAARVVGKLFADRAAPGGRLDQYYRAGRPLLTLAGQPQLVDQPLTLVVNDRPHRIDLAAVLDEVRAWFRRDRQVWAATTQGDPTVFNLAWIPQAGPVWMDFDTAGLNALAGEFAVLLTDLLLHSALLTPVLAPASYRDHPTALAVHRPADVTVLHARPGLIEATLAYRPPPGRRQLAGQVLDDLVVPLARQLGEPDLLAWLRPYLLMRLLAVFPPADLPIDGVLVLLATLARLTADQPDTVLDLFTHTPGKISC